MKIIKRNGSEATFDLVKIIAAVTKANNVVAEDARMTPMQIRRIAESVENSCLSMNRALSVEEIQDLVEDQIMAHGAFEVAKNYITYRYTRTLVRKSNTTDEKILSLIESNNEEVKQENSNKNPTVNAVQRDYMAGEVSKDLTARVLLPQDIVEAHNEGASSTSTTRITSPSICTTAIWSISRICCRTARSSPARSSKSRTASPRPATSPRRSSRRSPPTSMAASPFR